MRMDHAAYASLWLALPSLAAAASAAAGDAACISCHAVQTARYRATPMAQALAKVERCDILIRHPNLPFQEGPYKSRITRQGDRSILTVSDGTESLTVPLLWAFGRGQAGQTYIFEYDGAFYESRVSFYNALNALDLTMGAMGSKPQNIVQAAGRRMDAIGARDCFGCHSAEGVSEGKLHMETLSPGVGCESCHGPAAKHVNATRSGDATRRETAAFGHGFRR